MAPGAEEDRHHLLFDWHRAVLRLLEQLDQAGAAIKLILGRFVEVGGERRERLELAVLPQVQTQTSSDLFHSLDLCGAAHTRHRDTDVDCGPHALVEQVGLQEVLTVGDRDDVRRDVGGDVVGLGLDDRQTGQRATAEFVRELGAAFQQPRVQEEDVARVRLTAGRAASSSEIAR